MMNYYSTRDHSFKFPFEHAIYMGPGLWMGTVYTGDRSGHKHFIETIE